MLGARGCDSFGPVTTWAAFRGPLPPLRGSFATRSCHSAVGACSVAQVADLPSPPLLALRCPPRGSPPSSGSWRAIVSDSVESFRSADSMGHIKPCPLAFYCVVKNLSPPGESATAAFHHPSRRWRALEDLVLSEKLRGITWSTYDSTTRAIGDR